MNGNILFNNGNCSRTIRFNVGAGRSTCTDVFVLLVNHLFAAEAADDDAICAVLELVVVDVSLKVPSL
jgi:hypothetical protein